MRDAIADSTIMHDEMTTWRLWTCFQTYEFSIAIKLDKNVLLFVLIGEEENGLQTRFIDLIDIFGQGENNNNIR